MLRSLVLLAMLASASALSAIAVIYDPSGATKIGGIITFTQNEREQTTYQGNVTGLADGQHGIHIHQYGDFSQGCASAGAHLNPFNHTHGGPQDEIRHVGDLGNIASSNGLAIIRGSDRELTLFGEYSIIGRSIVVHADQDDLGRGSFPDSKTTGHSGARIACGIIGLTP
eukprot:m.228036 g.228036  ORF g.228036 m.228036 type:complete len:170 (-) comp11683_c0_seq1:44-553(-)